MLRYVFLLFVLNLSLIFAQEIEDNQLLWVNQAIANDSMRIIAVSMTTDDLGNSYASGNFSGSKSFGNYTLTSTDNDGFVVKYALDGTVLWARQTYTLGGIIGGFGRTAIISAIESDAKGNLYVWGIADTVNFGDGVTLSQVKSSPYKNGNFIAKYSSDGQILWAKRIKKYNGGLNSFAVDAKGYINIGGDFGYVAKYNPDGNNIWDTHANFENMGNSLIATDKEGNIVETGRFSGNGYYDNGITLVASKGSANIYLTKYNNAGVATWALSLGSDSSYNVPHSITTDDDGNIYLLGEFSKEITLGNGVSFKNIRDSATQYFHNYFIAKYFPDCSLSWAKEIINANKDGGLGTARNIDVDKDGYVYISGNSSDTLVKGDFLAIYSPDGQIVQTRKLSDNTNGFSYIMSLKVDKFNNIFSAGFFSSTVEFGKNNTLSIDSSGSMFVAKYTAFNTTGIENDNLLKPSQILSIHPNPAQSTSRISFKTTAPSHTRLTLTDVLGRQTLLKEETLDAGEHSTEINTANFPAGIYVLTLEAEGQVFSQKVVIER
ncbi:MAG: T9SS type A sorting domain-containing protein [Bacteroidota bacterium]